MKKTLSVFLTIVLLLTVVTGNVFAQQGEGQTFKDIKGHWGVASIMRMQELGILDGYEDGTFRPNNPLTPEELAVILDRIMDRKLGVDSDTESEEEDDEEEEEGLAGVPAWARKAVARGFTFRYLEMKRFHSHVQVSRLSVAVAIAKALDLEPVEDFESNPFRDVDISDEDYGYLIALYEEGIIKGYPDGNFNPNGFVNRGQMASIISGIFDDEDDEEEADDMQAPVWPSGASITLTAPLPSSVELSWPEATDNEEVVAYKVYQNNVLLETLDSDETEYVVTGLIPDEEYSFKVRAVDDEGNLSKSLRKNYTTQI
jgi:hypothetical protein